MPFFYSPENNPNKAILYILKRHLSESVKTYCVRELDTRLYKVHVITTKTKL